MKNQKLVPVKSSQRGVLPAIDQLHKGFIFMWTFGIGNCKGLSTIWDVQWDLLVVGANCGLSWANLGYLNTDPCLSTPRSRLRSGWVHRTQHSQVPGPWVCCLLLLTWGPGLMWSLTYSPHPGSLTGESSLASAFPSFWPAGFRLGVSRGFWALSAAPVAEGCLPLSYPDGSCSHWQCLFCSPGRLVRCLKQNSQVGKTPV